ncbi:MAG: hypothetical protein IKD79_05405, partial [Oscillospiraceae bacterium]|nr:hypothetical protein [Oscillospiraceae bacterium]
MLMLLAAAYFLLDAPGQDHAVAATLQPAELAETRSEELRAASIPEATADPAGIAGGEDLRTPPGKGVYAATARPDGRSVTPKDDLCYWGMELLDRDAKVHRCRFRSGSGQLLPDYDWGVPVPESEEVDQEWFSDAVFIGNSLAQGLMLYGGLKTADMYAM